MKDDHTIYGVHITNRVQEVPAVQQVLTEFGGLIRTRLGLHEVQDGHDSPSGLLILEMVGDAQKKAQFEKALKAIGGVQVQKMVFPH
jgi:hypothetical protein